MCVGRGPPFLPLLLFLAGFECEKDELAELVENLKHAGLAASHRRGLTVHRKSFTGAQLLEWLQGEKGMGEYGRRRDGQAGPSVVLSACVCASQGRCL